MTAIGATPNDNRPTILAKSRAAIGAAPLLDDAFDLGITYDSRSARGDVMDYGLVAMGVALVFLATTLKGDNVAIDQIRIMDGLGTVSHDELALTRELMDELRGYYDRAATELTGVEVGSGGLDRSVNSVVDYFGLQAVINDVRDMVGVTSYHVTSEIVPDGDGIRFRARIFTATRTEPAFLVTVTGRNGEFEPLLHEAALQLLARLDPYLVALHDFHDELNAGDFAFPKTLARLDRPAEGPERLKPFQRSALIGRIHRMRAERDAALGPEQRAAELAAAVDYLKAALKQSTGFFRANQDLAAVYADRHEYGLADQVFAAAVRIRPNNLAIRRQWADVLAAQGRRREAIFQYAAAVELAPEDADLRDSLAELYLATDHPDAAREQWQAALTIDPGRRAVAERLESLAPR